MKRLTPLLPCLKRGTTMNEDITQDVHLIMQQVYSENTKGTNQEPDEEEEVIQVHHYPNAIVIIKEPGKSTSTNIPIVDNTPNDTQESQALQVVPYLTVGIFLLLILSSLMFQFYVLLNPFTVTVTLAAKEQQVSLAGSLQLGRVLSPITVSQSATLLTTGHGHQDAKQATGTVTFYNGSNVAQTINAGTVLTGQDSVQVATDQTLTVPAANLPQIGQATVSAHAVNAGSAGNIPAYDITIALSNDLTVKNLTSFMGGQDERNFQTVAKTDITNATIPLNVTLAQSIQGALQGQLKTNETVVTPSCATTTTPDHRPGEEATTVKVTVSETCSAIAYNQDTLQAKVTQLLTTQAAKKLETGYSLLGIPQITVTSATPSRQVTLSFSSVSTWVYALGSAEQKNIKKIIAGKNTQDALKRLYSLPGVESVSMHFAGFGDDSRIPKEISHIHLALFYGL